MPSDEPRTPKKKSGRFGNYEFINVALSSSDKDRLAGLDLEQEFPWSGIVALVSEMFKVSFSYDAKNDTHICSFTDRRMDLPSGGHILTGRGATTFDAWAAACYKHFYICEEDWGSYIRVKDSPKGRFG